MKTQLSQVTSSYEDELGDVHFKIENTVTFVVEGDLPSKDVFVFSAEVAVDPKADVFQRIATLIDLTTVTRGRAAALAKGQKNYLTASFTIDYPSLTVAVEGKRVIRARLDALIADWRAYQEKFLNPTTFDLPLGETPVVQASKEALKKALAEKNAREAEFADIASQLDASRQAAQFAATDLSQKLSAASACTQVLTLLTSAVSGQQAFNDNVVGAAGLLAAARTFFEAAKLFNGPAQNDFAAAVEAFGLVLGTSETAATELRRTTRGDLDAALAGVREKCALAQAQALQARGQKQAADAALATMQTKASLAEQAISTASAVVDAALVQVTNYCPNFNPATDL